MQNVVANGTPQAPRSRLVDKISQYSALVNVQTLAYHPMPQSIDNKIEDYCDWYLLGSELCELDLMQA
jgi:hypothetical protein